MKHLLVCLALAALAASTIASDVNYGSPKISVSLGTNTPVAGLLLKSDGVMNYWGSGDGAPGMGRQG